MLNCYYMDYLDRFAAIADKAGLTEEENNTLKDLTDPIARVQRDYSYIELYNIFKKLFDTNQADDLYELVLEKKASLKLEPNDYPSLNDEVRIG